MKTLVDILKILVGTGGIGALVSLYVFLVDASGTIDANETLIEQKKGEIKNNPDSRHVEIIESEIKKCRDKIVTAQIKKKLGKRACCYFLVGTIFGGVLLAALSITEDKSEKQQSLPIASITPSGEMPLSPTMVALFVPTPTNAPTATNTPAPTVENTPSPTEIIKEEESIRIPDLIIGMPREDAIEYLKNLEINFRIEKEYSDTVLYDRVIRTNPSCGNTIKRDELITVFVSLGKETYVVPNLMGMNLDNATTIALSSHGCDCVIYTDCDELVDESIVIWQWPKAFEKRQTNYKCALLFGKAYTQVYIKPDGKLVIDDSVYSSEEEYARFILEDGWVMVGDEDGVLHLARADGYE